MSSLGDEDLKKGKDNNNKRYKKKKKTYNNDDDGSTDSRDSRHSETTAAKNKNQSHLRYNPRSLKHNYAIKTMLIT